MSEPARDSAPVAQRVEIDAPREQVFSLFTEPESLVRWWPEAATFEPRVGGAVRLVFGPGDVTGRVTAFEPPSRLAFSWIRSDAADVETHVEVSFDDLGGERCAVEVVHTGWEAVPPDARVEWRAMHEHGWAYFLPLLVALAEGRPVDKAPPTN